MKREGTRGNRGRAGFSVLEKPRQQKGFPAADIGQELRSEQDHGKGIVDPDDQDEDRLERAERETVVGIVLQKRHEKRAYEGPEPAVKIALTRIFHPSRRTGEKTRKKKARNRAAASGEHHLVQRRPGARCSGPVVAQGRGVKNLSAHEPDEQQQEEKDGTEVDELFPDKTCRAFRLEDVDEAGPDRADQGDDCPQQQDKADKAEGFRFRQG